jgi:hypothetical protein
MDDEQRIARSHQAGREFKQLEAVFASTEQALVKKIASVPITNPETVLRVHAGLQALDMLRTGFRMMIDDGLAAEHAMQAAGLTRD